MVDLTAAFMVAHLVPAGAAFIFYAINGRRMSSDAHKMAQQEAEIRKRRDLKSHQRQLGILERQSKERLLMARGERDSAVRTPELGDAWRLPTRQEYEMELAVIEQRNMPRLRRWQQEQESEKGELKRQDAYVSSAQYRDDYYAQLALIEERNKRRWLAAKMEEERTGQSGMPLPLSPC